LGLLPPLCFLAGRWRVAYEFYRRGMAAISAGDHDRALTLASEAVRLEPALALYWAGRGFARYYLADYQAAIADLSQAIKLDRAVEQAHAYRGLAYLALNEPQLALDDLSLHACVGVDDAWVAWYRATAREEVFAWERAAEDYRLAYRLDESLHAAVICLARLQACCPLAALRDGAKAIANAERICVLEGWTNYISVSVLAAGYAESGDFATAIRYARQAHDLAPDDDKPNRLQRIEEYQRGECYRLPGLNFTVECNAP
jgi:tetratricopeptide (TPR) repeat protein